jgi:Recombinase
VRTLFEKFDSGVSIVGLNRWLQANEIKTRFGKTLWHTCQVKNILQCRTYMRIPVIADSHSNPSRTAFR